MSVNRMRKCLSFALVFVVLLSIPVNAQRNEVNVILDGAGVDIETILENDRTFLPIKALGENLDFSIQVYMKKISMIHMEMRLASML